MKNTQELLDEIINLEIKKENLKVASELWNIEIWTGLKLSLEVNEEIREIQRKIAKRTCN